MKVEIEVYFNVMCPNEHGANGEEFVTIINRRVELEKCRKCKWYKGYDMKYHVICDYKGKK